jgi:hypothetical protein
MKKNKLKNATKDQTDNSFKSDNLCNDNLKSNIKNFSIAKITVQVKMVKGIFEKFLIDCWGTHFAPFKLSAGLVYHMANIHWGPSGCRYQEVFHLAWSTVLRE